jgi:hypothetical protein
MPQLVGEIEQPATVIAGIDPMVLIQVGHVGKINVQSALVGPGDVAAYRRLDESEIPGESELLFIADILAPKHQYSIAVHAGLDGGDCLRAQWVLEIDTSYFPGKGTVQRTD